MPWVPRKHLRGPDELVGLRGLGRSQDSEKSHQSGASACRGSEKASIQEERRRDRRRTTQNRVR